jgi:phage terminase Nu1 subunit (DNA packaging protein)
MATIAECAKHLNLSERRVIELLEAGVFERQDRGAYDLGVVRVAYIRYLRQRALGARERTDAELERAMDEARLTKARADRAVMEAEEMRQSLIPTSQVLAAVRALQSIAIDCVSRIPKRAAKRAREARSIAEAERIIRAEVNAALDQIGKTQIVTKTTKQSGAT